MARKKKIIENNPPAPRRMVMVLAVRYRTFNARGQRIELKQNQIITHPWPSLLAEALNDVGHRSLKVIQGD